jgi:hypothetical protein
MLDIAIANYDTDNIAILLGCGNGTFVNQKTYATAFNSNPSSVAVRDFNNDHNLDIVVPNYGTGNIGLLLGYGDGTFAAQRTCSNGSYCRPEYITIGDFNKDSNLDAVIIDSKYDQIHILLGYGNDTFATLTTYDAISGSQPFSVDVADFNKDNRSDIVVVNAGTDNALVLRGYSIKPSARQTDYFLGRAVDPTSVVISDFNNNSYPDLVVNSYFPDGILVMIDYVNGTFMGKTIYFTGNQSSPKYICIGDMNSDN